MKRSLPLYGAGRRVLCAAGLACALSSGFACLPALAESAAQAGSAAQQVSADAVTPSQLEELSSAAGQSTAYLVTQIEDALSQQGIAAAYSDSSASVLPVMPYVFGAAAALVGVGVFAGGFALLRRHRNHVENEARSDASAPSNADELLRDDDAVAAGGQSACLDPLLSAAASAGPSADDTAAFMALAGKMSPAQARQSILSDAADDAVPTCSPARPDARAYPSDDFDELESLAMGYVASCAPAASSSHPVPHRPGNPDDGPDGGPGHGKGGSPQAPSSFRTAPAREAYARTDLTMPLDCVAKQEDAASDFATTARVLATGAGEVHRVSVPSSHLDFSGMDIVDVTSTFHHDEPVADPMVSRDDWQGVALGELRAQPEGPATQTGDLSTEDYMALIATKAQPAQHVKRQDYVAPVIGPGLDREAAARRQELMRSSDSPAAALLVDRDEEFLANRARQHGEAPNGGMPTRQSAVSAAHPVPGSQAAIPTSARPGPAAHGSSVFQRVGVDFQSEGVPCASSFVPPRPPSSSSVVSDRGLAAAVAAATSAYAAFNSYSTMSSAPVSSASATGSSQQERASRAASYAAAVYGVIEQPAARPVRSAHAGYGFISAEAPCSDVSNGEQPLSAVYINHLVQDEFDHRHDSPTQRNAALGRMQVINGSAVAPVSVRDSMRRNRA